MTRLSALLVVAAAVGVARGATCTGSLAGAICTSPLDFVLLVDNSKGMQPYTDDITIFMQRFVESFALSAEGPNVAIVMFNSMSEVLVGLSYNTSALLEGIGTRGSPARGTVMRAGFETARDLLLASERSGYASPMVLLLSDGLSSSPTYRGCESGSCPLAKLTEDVLKVHGIAIFWISYKLPNTFSSWGSTPRDVLSSEPWEEYFTDGGDVETAVDSIGTIVDRSCISVQQVRRHSPSCRPICATPVRGRAASPLSSGRCASRRRRIATRPSSWCSRGAASST